MPTEAAVPQISAQIIPCLRCATTTNAHTLHLLRTNLGYSSPISLPESRRQQRLDAGDVGSQNTKAIKCPSQATRRKAAPALNIEVSEILTRSNEPLCVKARRKLATEAFNVALKTLSTAAKAHHDANLSTERCRTQTPAVKSKSVPLRQSSPNKQPKKVAKATSLKDESGNIEFVADCAALTLQCLQEFAEQDEKPNVDPGHTLERGALIFSEKLIALELPEKALQQMSRTYEQYWKRRKHLHGSVIRDNSESAACSSAEQSGSLPIRMPLSKNQLTEAEFGFVSTYQSQALRLAIQLGSEAIDAAFVSSISITSAGSPAAVCLGGLQNGLLDEQKAGQQLRTIAQALLKLYTMSTATKQARPIQAHSLLCLLTEALVIKCESWSLLHHKVELDRECWTYFMKGLKRYETGCQTMDSDAISHVFDMVQLISSALKLKHFTCLIPVDIVHTMLDMAEKTSCYSQGLQMLEACRKEQTDLPRIQQMLLSWRRAAFTHNISNKTTHSLLECFQSASQSFVDELSHQQPDSILLYAARLRKAVVSKVQNVNIPLSDPVELATLSCCIDILSKLATLLSNCTRQFCDENLTESWKTCLTGFTKTFEAILSLYKLNTFSGTALQNQRNHSLGQCITNTNTLLIMTAAYTHDFEVMVYIRNLLAQASHQCWLQYVQTTVSAPLSQSVIDLLHQSCTSLEQLPAQNQRKASYGMKLEKLALAYLAKKDYSIACSAFEAAVRHYIALGALIEPAGATLAGPSSRIWSEQGTSSYALGKAITSLTKLRLTYEVQNDAVIDWVYKMDELPVLHQCLLFELQMLASSNHSFSESQRESFKGHATMILDMCSEPQLCIYRLYIASAIFQLISKNPSLAGSDLLQCIQPATLVEMVPAVSADVPLSSFAASLQHTLHIQVLLQSGQVDAEVFEHHVRSLSSLVTNSSDAANLKRLIYDPDFLVKLFQAVIDFAQLLDHMTTMIVCLVSMKHVLTLAVSNAETKLANVLTQLAILYYRQGNIMQAGKAFASAKQTLEKVPVNNVTRARWQLSYTEFLEDTGNKVEANNNIEYFLQHATEDHEDAKEQSGRTRLEKVFLMSRTAQVASNLAFNRGSIGMATQLARKAVRLSTEVWQSIEKSQPHFEVSSGHENDTSLSSITKDMSNLNLSLEQIMPQQQYRSGPYWIYVNLHCSALGQMSNLSVHNGLYQDAVHYAEQWRKIAAATGSHIQNGRALANLALLHAKGGNETKAGEALRMCGSLPADLSCHEGLQAGLARAEALIEMHEITDAMVLIESVTESLMNVERVESATLVQSHTEVGVKKAPARGRAKPTNSIKGPAKRPGQKAKRASPNDNELRSETKTTCRRRLLQDQCEALKNQALLLQGDCRAAKLFAGDSMAYKERLGLATITDASIMLQQAAIQLSSDAVKCVLAETAVALPVKYRSSRKSGRVSSIQVADSPFVPKTARSGRGKNQTTKSITEKQPLTAGEQLIVDAQKLLHNFQDGNQTTWPAELVHVAQKVYSKAVLLSSTMRVPFQMSSSELVLRSLISKDVVRMREQSTVLAERAIREKAQLLTWPNARILPDQALGEALEFSEDDLSELPSTWSIVTISLADDQKELLMSRITSDRSPFLLRIPLSRSDLDIDEDEFTFQDAKAELSDIINEANVSAHDTRGQGNREARKAWYAEREELDQRLEAWLCNVESVWLGGFRGLMHSETFSDAALTTFGQKLNEALDKHLPSRQKSTSGKTNRVALHAHVLELFLGLGHPDGQELEDPMTDLLYFVIDILQFNGEHNAYDEIDIDAILVDTIDALHSCHNLQSQESEQQTRHTILVVDKEMASFPWESLPCLRHQAISRMPSLGSIFHRLKRIQAQSSAAQGYNISLSSGAYILNPSSDLPTTQSTFQPILQNQLPALKSMINKAPTESEFTSFLTTNELLLYLGHGSGAQYVRGRAIRNLDKCAVTLLMGCSSARMTECGKFESYGMPGYYMNGMSGCMAVVGTLWDVTDRDIDRFALKTMTEWGMIEEDEHVTKALERSNRKTMKQGQKSHKGENRTGRKGVVSLDEAVNKGRDACLLRFLNGAAPVIYGVPAFLR